VLFVIYDFRHDETDVIVLLAYEAE